MTPASGDVFSVDPLPLEPSRTLVVPSSPHRLAAETAVAIAGRDKTDWRPCGCRDVELRSTAPRPAIECALRITRPLAFGGASNVVTVRKHTRGDRPYPHRPHQSACEGYCGGCLRQDRIRESRRQRQRPYRAGHDRGRGEGG